MPGTFLLGLGGILEDNQHPNPPGGFLVVSYLLPQDFSGFFFVVTAAVDVVIRPLLNPLLGEFLSEERVASFHFLCQSLAASTSLDLWGHGARWGSEGT